MSDAFDRIMAARRSRIRRSRIRALACGEVLELDGPFYDYIRERLEVGYRNAMAVAFHDTDPNPFPRVHLFRRSNR